MEKSREEERQAQLQTIVAQHTAPLRRYFSRKGYGAEDVEDLVQDVFTRLARLDDPMAIETPQAFVFQIAANLVKDRARRSQSRQVNAHLPFDDVLHGYEELSAERVLIGKQRLDRLKTIIQSLPKKTAFVFLLNRFEGLTYREIAEALSMSVSAVEKHMMTALARIAKEMDAE